MLMLLALLSFSLCSAITKEEHSYALMNAVLRGDIERIYQKDLFSKADINFQEPNGKTVLHYAMESNQPEYLKDAMVLLLLYHGASVDIKDNNGDTPLYRALDLGLFKLVVYLMNPQIKMN